LNARCRRYLSVIQNRKAKEQQGTEERGGGKRKSGHRRDLVRGTTSCTMQRIHSIQQIVTASSGNRQDPILIREICRTRN